ncbi:hypothetical protein J2S37_002606 [Corynebacterium felinum]|uniref:Uncharacterized protein n=1 Tax=Corynebacterium felinum TaxID=131318 RepID=A0ABU2BEB6_9CORY|nr:hypothetical protein [Corynebacterium felinum]
MNDTQGGKADLTIVRMALAVPLSMASAFM